MKSLTNKNVIKLLRVVTILLTIIITIKNLKDANESAQGLFIAVQLLVGVGLMYVPEWLSNLFKTTFPDVLSLLYVIFIFCSVFLGTGLGFYTTINHWDKILHFLSGGLLAAFGVTIAQLFVGSKISDNRINKLIIVFSFLFAITLGVVWEFYEFSFDGLLNLNMQRFALDDGTELIGRAALMDTMSDLFVDTLGAGLMMIWLLISSSKDNALLNKFKLKNKESM